MKKLLAIGIKSSLDPTTKKGENRKGNLSAENNALVVGNSGVK